MAVKTPIVYDDAGRLQQLQSGDTIPGGGDAPAEFPDWTSNGDQWEDTQNAMVDLFDSKRATGGSNYSTFGTVAAGSIKWMGGVLATNNCIYGIPYSSSAVLKIDTSDDTVGTFGSVSPTAGWWGGVLAPNGHIYCIPYNSTAVLKINTANDTVTTFGSLSGTSKWAGGVVAQDGNIYGIPFSSTSVLKINTANDTVTTFGSLSGATKWVGGVLTPSGNICGVMYSSTSSLDIDTGNDAAATFTPTDAAALKWRGGVLGADGAVYGMPSSRNLVCRVDLDARTLSYTTKVFGAATYKWSGGCIAPDGKIHAAPHYRNYRLVVNPSTEVGEEAFTTFSNATNFLYAGLVLAPNGHMYGIPSDATTVYKLSTSFGAISANFCLSRFFNKY
jgi:DNA-binding beta-propeller fold protein YncE